jgi:hypothetical protein
MPTLREIDAETDSVRRAQMQIARLSHIRELARQHPNERSAEAVQRIDVLRSQIAAQAARAVRAREGKTSLTLVATASKKGA